MPKKTQGRQARELEPELLAMLQEGEFPDTPNGEHRLDITFLPNEYSNYYPINQARWGNILELCGHHPERPNKSDRLLWRYGNAQGERDRHSCPSLPMAAKWHQCAIRYRHQRYSGHPKRPSG